jgi:hypothetical protein
VTKILSPDEEIRRRMSKLMLLINAMDCLSMSLSVWLALRDNDKNGVSHKLTASHKRLATDAEAMILQLARNEATVYRTGSLWADLSGVPTPIVPSANALVVTSRLSSGVLADLRNEVPLGIALRKVGVRRHTQPPAFELMPDDTSGTRLAMRLTSTLFVGGRPWAVTDELIDQAVVEHREPGPAVLTQIPTQNHQNHVRSSHGTAH